MYTLMQVIKMSDEVTVSSLPHPISMFFLGIFAVTIIYMVIEINRIRKEWEKLKHLLDNFENRVEEHKNDTNIRMSDMSKKIDSRVDKALVNLTKKREVL